MDPDASGPGATYCAGAFLLAKVVKQFATRFGLEVDAVRNWEHGRRIPDAAARSLLNVIARYPDLVVEAQDG